MLRMGIMEAYSGIIQGLGPAKAQHYLAAEVRHLQAGSSHDMLCAGRLHAQAQHAASAGVRSAAAPPHPPHICCLVPCRMPPVSSLGNVVAAVVADLLLQPWR
jgi:hypothetical protein